MNYFFALAAVGSFLALLAMGPFAEIARLLIASALGWPEDSEPVKIGANVAVASLWMLVLIGYWIRKGGLAPQSAKPGRKHLHSARESLK